MRFPGIKATIGLPVLLAIGVALIVYGILRADRAGVILGIADIVLSVVFYVTTIMYKRGDTQE